MLINLEFWLFGNRRTRGPGLPPPPERRTQKAVHVDTSGARLVSAETRTWEWDIARTRPANAPAELTDAEIHALERASLKNLVVNARVKLARVQGLTIAEAAKNAGCGFSTAQKIYGVLSRFEQKGT